MIVPKSDAFRRWLENPRKREVARLQPGAVPKVEVVEDGDSGSNSSDGGGASKG